MLGFTDIAGKTMTLSSSNNSKLTQKEFDELTALKNAINESPQTVIPQKMEEFTAYMVRSLRERGG